MLSAVSVSGRLQGVVEAVWRDRLMCCGLFQSLHTAACVLSRDIALLPLSVKLFSLLYRSLQQDMLFIGSLHFFDVIALFSPNTGK